MNSYRQKMIDQGATARELVTVTGLDGESFPVEVRALKAGERGRILTACLITKPTVDGEESETEADQEKLGPMLVLACACDPETHTQIFDAADEEVIASLSATFIDPIVKAATRLSGLSAGTAKQAEKNSEPTTVSVPASDSPAS